MGNRDEERDGSYGVDLGAHMRQPESQPSLIVFAFALILLIVAILAGIVILFGKSIGAI
jgi:hypothetical protein